MKQKLLWVILALVTAVQAATLDGVAPNLPTLKPDVQEAQAARLAAGVLSRYHYKPVALDDALSTKVFDQYLKALDSEKLYFLQSDIDRLGVERTRLDDAILTEDLRAPFAIFNLYERRLLERLADFGQIHHARVGHRRGDHENHQQHQRHVDIGHDVDLVHQPTGTSAP